MNRTRIEWCDYTVNPVKGYCPMACEYCYARAMYGRFKWDKTIRFDQTVFFKLPMKPSRIFVGSTIELFGDWVAPDWLETILTICRQHSEHTFIFLTKCPQNLARWNPWPDNCQVGISITNLEQYRGLIDLAHVQGAARWISFEPLLNHIPINFADFYGISWIVLGGKSGRKPFYPPEAWIAEIELVADRLHIPCFEKNNLRPKGAWEPRRELRREKGVFCYLDNEPCLPDEEGFGRCGDLLKTCLWAEKEKRE